MIEASKYIKYILSNGVKEIILYPMIHVNNEDTYNKLQHLWIHDYNRGFKLHLEGVKVPKKLSKKGHKLYSLFAEILGFVNQPKPHAPYVVHDLEYEHMSLTDKIRIHGMFNMMNLGGFFIEKSHEESPKKTLEELTRVFNEPANAEKNSRQTRIFELLGYKKLILDSRNEYAIKKALDEPMNVSLIWGAAHIEGMINLLEENNYRVTAKVKSIDS